MRSSIIFGNNAIEVSDDGKSYSALSAAECSYDSSSSAGYSYGDYSNAYTVGADESGVYVRMVQTYSQNGIWLFAIDTLYIGDGNNYNGRIYVSGDYNEQYVSKVSGGASDGGLANPSGAGSASGGRFTRYWTMEESTLGVSLGMPDSDCTFEIAYTAIQNDDGIESGSFNLFDAPSHQNGEQSYEDFYSSLDVDDYRSNLYSYCTTKYFFAGRDGVLCFRYLTPIVEQKLYVALGDDGSPVLRLEGYFGTAATAQLGLTVDGEILLSNKAEGASRDKFVLEIKVSDVTAGVYAMRVYNDANGDETMEHYYAVKPAYNAEADTQATVEFGGKAYSIYVENNFYRLKVEEITG